MLALGVIAAGCSTGGRSPGEPTSSTQAPLRVGLKADTQPGTSLALTADLYLFAQGTDGSYSRWTSQLGVTFAGNSAVWTTTCPDPGGQGTLLNFAALVHLPDGSTVSATAPGVCHADSDNALNATVEVQESAGLGLADNGVGASPRCMSHKCDVASDASEATSAAITAPCAGQSGPPDDIFGMLFETAESTKNQTFSGTDQVDLAAYWGRHDGGVGGGYGHPDSGASMGADSGSMAADSGTSEDSGVAAEITDRYLGYRWIPAIVTRAIWIPFPQMTGAPGDIQSREATFAVSHVVGASSCTRSLMRLQYAARVFQTDKTIVTFAMSPTLSNVGVVQLVALARAQFNTAINAGETGTVLTLRGPETKFASGVQLLGAHETIVGDLPSVVLDIAPVGDFSTIVQITCAADFGSCTLPTGWVSRIQAADAQLGLQVSD
jgi:hypothetical protein